MSFVTNRVKYLNNAYKKGIEISLILVLLLIIAAFKFAPDTQKTEMIKENGQELFFVSDITPSRQIQQPPPPRPPVLVETASADQMEDIILSSTEIDENDPVPVINHPPEPPKDNDEFVPFAELESEPSIVGGIESLIKKIHYTELARRAEIEGTVVIEIIINKKGDVEDAKIIRSLNSGLDEIALQAVKSTRFIPGMQRDKPVKVKMTIPIKFKLR